MNNTALWSVATLLLLIGSGMIGYSIRILYVAYGRKPVISHEPRSEQ
jgi:hypothetical protein